LDRPLNDEIDPGTHGLLKPSLPELRAAVVATVDWVEQLGELPWIEGQLLLLLDLQAPLLPAAGATGGLALGRVQERVGGARAALLADFESNSAGVCALAQLYGALLPVLRATPAQAVAELAAALSAARRARQEQKGEGGTPLGSPDLSFSPSKAARADVTELALPKAMVGAPDAPDAAAGIAESEEDEGEEAEGCEGEEDDEWEEGEEGAEGEEGESPEARASGWERVGQTAADQLTVRGNQGPRARTGRGAALAGPSCSQPPPLPPSRRPFGRLPGLSDRSAGRGRRGALATHAAGRAGARGGGPAGGRARRRGRRGGPCRRGFCGRRGQHRGGRQPPAPEDVGDVLR
jgi:hypothetical protein